MTLNVHGSTVDVTSIATTAAFGGLDLEVHYNPNAAQLAQLRDPVAARKQAIDVMTALLTLHPELRASFRGIWVHADQGSASVYALDLPMDQIAAVTEPTASSSPIARQQ